MWSELVIFELNKTKWYWNQMIPVISESDKTQWDMT